MDILSYELGKKAGGGGTPSLQSKSVTITENGTTNVTADEGYDGLSEVSVTSNVPTGDLSDYFDDTLRGGNSYVAGWVKSIKKLNSPMYRENNSISYAFSGFLGETIPTINSKSSANLEIMSYAFNTCSNLKNINLNYLDVSHVTDMSRLFNGCSSLTNIDISEWVTSSVTNVSGMFASCRAIETIDVRNIDTSKATNMASMFQSCDNLKTIQCNLDFSACLDVRTIFSSSSKLENLGTLSNIGKAFLTTVSSNYNKYTFNIATCGNLTHDSLMNIINGLYDIASAGVRTQDLVLGATNIAKLTADEIAIATNKGWTVS